MIFLVSMQQLLSSNRLQKTVLESRVSGLKLRELSAGIELRAVDSEFLIVFHLKARPTSWISKPNWQVSLRNSKTTPSLKEYLYHSIMLFSLQPVNPRYSLSSQLSWATIKSDVQRSHM